jgi:indole-3-glycerol phosphate synthase
MPSILDTIVAHKRVEVAKARVLTPIEILKERVAQMERPRNFFAAVASGRDRSRTRVIAEIKRCSPSAGVIREDFDPVDIARRYTAAGAAAISCLTDERYFGGHLGYLRQIKDAVGLPVLRKDFIVDEYQVWESRAAHADAILLIAELLPEGDLLDLMILAQQLGMTTLVEAHEVEHVLRVRRHIGFPHATYSLLGINNRDLHTMETDINHTLRMVELVENTQVLVSESGIRGPEDLRRLRRAGVHIVLVGEHLMRQPDPGEALRQLLSNGTAPPAP